MTATTNNNFNNKLQSFLEKEKEIYDNKILKEKEKFDKFEKEKEFLFSYIPEIKKFIEYGLTTKQIAKHFNVSKPALQQVRAQACDGVTGFSELKDTDPEELEMLLQGLPLGYVGSFSAAGGAGKSTFIFQLMCQICCGVNLTNLNTALGKVAYLPAEDDKISVRHKIAAVMGIPEPSGR